MTLEEAAAQADVLAQQGDERGLATLRQQWDEELEHAARSADYRVRAHAYRAIMSGKSMSLPGWRAKLGLQMLRFGSRNMATGVAARLNQIEPARALTGQSSSGS